MLFLVKLGTLGEPLGEPSGDVGKPSRGGETLGHTAGSDTIFVQIYMDTLPGVPGVSKNQNFFFTNKTVEFLR